MRLITTSFHLIIMLTLSLTGLTSVSASETIEIEDAWIAEAPPVSRVHAGYLELENKSDRHITLTGVSSSQYREIELHRSIERDGIARMQPVESLSIAPGSDIEFEPGSYHLMMFGPKKRLHKGDEVDLVFDFNDGSQIDVTAVVRKHLVNSHNHHDHKSHKNHDDHHGKHDHH